ncbi:MAG: oligosaccharide flippase family protein [Myxococcota bacterium]|nr:oligosaccharide flippase family protein [Myxococcota bacterium]
MRRSPILTLFFDVVRQLGVLVFVKASGLVTTLVLSRALGVAGLGAWAGISAAAAMIAVVGGLGLYQAIIQFYPQADSDPDRGGMLWSASLAVLGTSAALAVLGLALSAALRALGQVEFGMDEALLSVVLALCMALRLLLLNHFRALGKLKEYSLATVLAECVELVACVGAALIFRSVLAVAIAVCLAILGSSVALFAIALRDLGPVRRAPGLLRPLLGYGIPLAGTQLADTVLARGDRLIVGGLLGGAATGIYAASYALVSIPSVLSSAVTTVLFPRLAAKFWSSADARRARMVSLAAYAGCSTALLVALTLCSRPLLSLLLDIIPPPDVNVPLLFFLTGAGVCLFGAARILSVDLFVSRRTARAAVVWASIAALNVAMNLALVPSSGLLGAGLANFLSYLAFLLAILVYVKRPRRRREAEH